MVFVLLQNNPLNKTHIVPDQKSECETKKIPLKRTLKLLDIVLKFLNLFSWFLEFLFQGFKKFFERYF